MWIICHIFVHFDCFQHTRRVITAWTLALLDLCFVLLFAVYKYSIILYFLVHFVVICLM